MGCVQRNAPAALFPGKRPGTHLLEAGWHQGTSVWVRNISTAPGFDPRTFQLVASRYTDWAIPAPYIYIYICVCVCVCVCVTSYD